MKNLDVVYLPRYFFMLSTVLAILLKWMVAIYPYSGKGKPPMYGDYEAQRHWQEITLHIPIEQWYVNTTQNHLQYWGLDYPPLAAYHSLAIGYIAEILDPESVVLFASRGYESDSHKLFMRWSVFISDLYFYIPSLIGYIFINYKLTTKELKSQGVSTTIKNAFFLPEVLSFLSLIYPGLILIDYGHFQYNCVSLGILVWSITFLQIGKFTMASCFFVVAVNFKQMELYHSLPFFLFLLRQCIPTKRKNFESCVEEFVSISLIVILTFVALWFPFLSSMQSIYQVLYRLFPIARGVFEDKVANVWCFINVFIKLKDLFSNAEMAKICLITTCTALLPSSMDLFFSPNLKKFILALINSSLSFFLFSFQVHEKSILLCAIPVMLHLPHDPIPCMWFLIVSNFSMLPLLIKDGLILAYLSLSVMYVSVFIIIIMMMDKNLKFMDIFNVTRVNNVLKGNQNGNFFGKIFNIFFLCSVLVMIALTFCSIFVSPPKRYPDLYPLLVSVFSCINFLYFYVYFNYSQMIIPIEQHYVTKKTSK